MDCAPEPEIDQPEGGVRFRNYEGRGSVEALLLGACDDDVRLSMGGDTADDKIGGTGQGEGVVGDVLVSADTLQYIGDGGSCKVVELDFVSRLLYSAKGQGRIGDGTLTLAVTLTVVDA